MEMNKFTLIPLILEAKLGDDSLHGTSTELPSSHGTDSGLLVQLPLLFFALVLLQKDIIVFIN